MSNDPIVPKDEKEVRLAKMKQEPEMQELLGAVAKMQSDHEAEAQRLVEVKRRRRRERHLCGRYFDPE